MAATDSQTLLDAAKCYQCFAANGYSVELMKLAILQQILLASNAAADVSPQGLLQQASCYQCYASNDYMLKLIELGLLAKIAGG